MFIILSESPFSMLLSASLYLNKTVINEENKFIKTKVLHGYEIIVKFN